jgi:hypothetical protein
MSAVVRRVWCGVEIGAVSSASRLRIMVWHTITASAGALRECAVIDGKTQQSSVTIVQRSASSDFCHLNARQIKRGCCGNLTSQIHPSSASKARLGISTVCSATIINSNSKSTLESNVLSMGDRDRRVLH